VTSHAFFRVPQPRNEPVRSYEPGSPERDELATRIRELGAERLELPLVIGGERVRTGDTRESVVPHRYAHVLADVHQGGAAEVERAARAASEAWHDWSRRPWEERVAVFLRAADLLTGPYRATLNAATMLGQSKTAHQAEIDAACELADFWRFNALYLTRIYSEQPDSPPGVWNRMEYRPLEGFVFAVTPFNFTSIAGNLPTAPALMGNTVVWKPASTAAYSAWFILQVLEEAGLPPGVVNLVYGPGGAIGDAALAHPGLAGVHFTGSTGVFHGMWKEIGANIDRYRNYPRIVGETGGKDFVLAHSSADLEALVTAVVRGGFEYQGQKCSAASRVFAPASVWPRLRERLVEEIDSLPMGDPTDFGTFVGAVIDRASFEKQRRAIEEARSSNGAAAVIAGGACDDEEGFFVRPTLIEAHDSSFRTMREELFGPVVTAHVYDDDRFDDVLDLVDRGTPYGLTGSIFARDCDAIARAEERLRYAAGNFYVNDKPTGAVVGQQPFGGARASGTNDKAGSMWNLARWVSPRAVKEAFVPPTDWRYPYLGAAGDAGR
jgi:1-pyrroline-5-carboxylate dehydrogenase